MADKINDDLFFGEILVAKKKLNRVTTVALTHWFKTSFSQNAVVIIKKSHLSRVGTKEGRLLVSGTLWHEYQHWSSKASESAAFGQEVDLAERLWWCWCAGNKKTRKSVTPSMLADFAKAAAEAGGHKIPAWVGLARRL